MSTAGNITFAVCALVAIVSAIATVAARRPLRAAMALLFHIVSLAGLYIVLHAHLLAALQLLVYAGAIVVLFVFVIMLIGPSAGATGTPRGIVVRTVSAATMAIVTGAIAFSVGGYDRVAEMIPACGPNTTAECGQFGGVEAVGDVLYRQALVPFEIVSLLLLVAIVGAVAVARGRSGQTPEVSAKQRAAAKVMSRLTTGPNP